MRFALRAQGRIAAAIEALVLAHEATTIKLRRGPDSCKQLTWAGRDGEDGPAGYHHGNLRESLVRAALALIAPKRARQFSTPSAEAARSAGSAPAAPLSPISLHASGDD